MLYRILLLRLGNSEEIILENKPNTNQQAQHKDTKDASENILSSDNSQNLKRTNENIVPNRDTRLSTVEKLKSRKRISQLFLTGKNVSAFPLKLLYLENELSEVPIQAGFTVPKRRFKLAVSRNRVKRLLRESYRLNKTLVFNNIERQYTFLFLYLGKEMPTQAYIEKNMVLVLEKFLKKIENEKK